MTDIIAGACIAIGAGALVEGFVRAMWRMSRPTRKREARH
jgi:hypothetical protein